jgi:type IV secretion system protein VirD4
MTNITPKQFGVWVRIAIALVFLIAIARSEENGQTGLWIALAAGLGCVVGWCFSPEGRQVRGIILLCVCGIGLFAILNSERELGPGLTTALCAAAFIAALIYQLSGLPAGSGPGRTFGSAQWAPLPYLRANGLLGGTGIRLGTFPGEEGPERITYASDRHLLTIAPTRKGKGASTIIPNLLTYRGSALVIDPKGENAKVTAAARGAMGQDIHVVDPWMIAPDASARPARFNPLDWLVKGDVDITENAMLLADALVMSEGKGEQFWTEEAKALLQGLILYVATDEHEQGARNLGRVRDLLLLDGEDMPELFQRMTQSLHHVVASTGARCLQKDEKLLANVIASAQAETHFLDSARIRESLSASDFRFEDLKTKAMTIYLVLPSDRLKAFGRWLRLLIQQAITVNARNIEIQPESPVLFLLDEMPALGRLSMVEQAFGLMAGFGMQLWGIVQDVSQLKSIYGDGWETFVGNSGAIQYFGSRDRMTAEYFSALCGVETVLNQSTAIGRAIGGNQGGSYTETSAEAQRKLAFPDELMRLPSDRQLILIENHHPIIGIKTRWYEDAQLATLGRNLRRQEVAAT